MCHNGRMATDVPGVPASYFPIQNLREHVAQQIVRRPAARDLFERAARVVAESISTSSSVAPAASAAAREPRRRARRQPAPDAARSKSRADRAGPRARESYAAISLAQLGHADAGQRGDRPRIGRSVRRASAGSHARGRSILLTTDEACRWHFQQRAILGCERNRRVDHDERQGSHLLRLLRACDTFGLDRIVRLANPGRVHERDRNTVDVDAFGDQIPRRPWHIRDDGARGADERVEQAGLARRSAGRGWRPCGLRGSRARFGRPCQAIEIRVDALGFARWHRRA